MAMRRRYTRRRSTSRSSVRRIAARSADRSLKRTRGRWDHFAVNFALAGNTEFTTLKLPRPPVLQWDVDAPITIYLLESIFAITAQSTSSSTGVRRGAIAGYKSRKGETPGFTPYNSDQDDANEHAFRWWMPFIVGQQASAGSALMLSFPLRFRTRKNQIRLLGNEEFYILIGAESNSDAVPLELCWHGRYRFIADKISG